MKLFKPSNTFKKNLLYTAIATTLSGFSFGANAMIESVPAKRPGSNETVTVLDATIKGTRTVPKLLLNIPDNVTANVVPLTGSVPYHTVDIKQGGKLSTNGILTSNLIVAGKLLSEVENATAVTLATPHRLYNTSDDGIAGLFYNENNSDFEFHKLNEQGLSLGVVPPENITTAQERLLTFTGTTARVRFGSDNTETFDKLTLTSSVLAIDLRAYDAASPDPLVQLDKIKVTGDGSALTATVKNSERILTHDLDLSGKGKASAVIVDDSLGTLPTLLPVALYTNGDDAGNLQPYEVGIPGGAQVHVGSGYTALLDIVDHEMVADFSNYDSPPAAAASVEAAANSEAPNNSGDEEVIRSSLRRPAFSDTVDGSVLPSTSTTRALTDLKIFAKQRSPSKPFNVVHVHGTLRGKIVGRTALNVHSGGVFTGLLKNKTVDSDHSDIVSHFYGGSTIKSAAIEGRADYGTDGGLVTIMPMEPELEYKKVIDLETGRPIAVDMETNGYSFTEMKLGGYGADHTVKYNSILFIDGHHHGHVKVAGDNSSHKATLRFEPGSVLKLKHHDLHEAPLLISATGWFAAASESEGGTPVDVISENAGLINELMVSGTLEDTPIHIAELSEGSRVTGTFKPVNSLGYELTIDPVSTAVDNGSLTGHINVASNIIEKLPVYTGLNKSMTSVLRAHLDSLASKKKDKTIQPKQAKALATVLAADPAHAATLAKQTTPFNAVNGSSIESCASTARASWAHIEQRLNGVAALPSGVATGD
ncbi:MAG: hypothetical protein PUP46_02930, partial [Endozoicomonas sp. (ex Botrylloides leachii)]|nr:hypothetical protein [Endozoicomonas sp. (ex Botrylloides leachii)]